ncbi:MAG: lipoprotein [Chromatiaceae bacterium]|nr:lipoprotein [Chromatiaceae bacterium]
MLCWAHKLFILVVLVLGVLSLLSACGQKGPLYLPPPPETAGAAPQSDLPPIAPTGDAAPPGNRP